MPYFSVRSTVLLFLVALAGCGMLSREPEKTLRAIIKTSNELADAMEKVKDAESAEAMTAEIDEKYVELIALYKTFPELIRKYKDAKVSKKKIDNLKAESELAAARVKSQAERINNLRGLPVEFWKVVNVRSTELVVPVLEMMRLSMPNMPADGLQQAQTLLNLMTTHGFEGVIVVELNNLSPALVGTAHERLKAAAPGSTIIANDIEGTHHVVVAPARDYKSFLKSLDLGTVLFEDEPQRLIRIEVDRLKLGAKANSDEEESRLHQEEVQRQIEETRKKMEEDRLRREAERAKEEEKRRLPDENDPNYYDALAERVLTGGHFERDDAIRILLATDPKKVPSTETRKKIARAFKQLAEQEHGFDQDKGIDGLVIWGGKYSVPILLKMLGDNPFREEKVIKALGELKDPRAVEPLVERLGNFHNKQAAYNALLDIGAPAEDALILLAPTNNPELCIMAIKLLGEVGTEKSLATLNRAMNNSVNPNVRFAAKIALRKISNRKSGKKSDDESDL